MLKFLKSVFGKSSGASTVGDSSGGAEAVEYQGYQIQPTPRQGKNGWTTEAIISREIEGELKTHHFIRADTVSDKQGAIDLSISKSKTTIDQVGERLFVKRS